MAYYGIDLGTSNCLVAKIVENLDGSIDVKCLSDDEGNESFPSIIHFSGGNNYLVGESAARKLSEYPQSTIELVKIRLGETTLPIQIGNVSYDKSPQEISALLLKHFNTLHNNEIDQCVLTVPAFFDQSQKDATMQAGQLAQIKINHLIEEPTAAIMYHLFSQYKARGIEWFSRDNHKNILVFDFGGGTLDLSLIRIDYIDGEVHPKVLAIGGDNKLGGNIIDFVFTKKVIQILVSQNKNDSFLKKVESAYSNYYSNYINNQKLEFTPEVDGETKNYIFRLKRNLEQVKIKLSFQSKAEIVFGGIYRPILITREQFQKTILQDDTINIIDRISNALYDVSSKKIPVSRVLLIGGSSQIPYIKETITEVLSEMGINESRVELSDDFEKAVAKGAAIQSAINQGVAVPPFMLNKCNSIVARDIEVEHAEHHSTLVTMGTEYPFEKKKMIDFKIGHALSKTVNLSFYEKIQQIDDIIKKKRICDVQFYLPVYYTNDKIIVSLNINEAGLYEIEAMHDESGENIEFEPHKPNSLSKAQLLEATISIKKMIDQDK